MKILVLGCGSIGTRRAKILAKMGHEIWCQDADIHMAVALTKGLNGHVYEGWQAVPFGAAVICTPPDSGRSEQIERCLGLGVKGLFVEKPLELAVSDIDEILRSISGIGLVTTMGACNLRFAGGVTGLRKIPKPWRLARFRMGQAAKFWSPTHKPISLILDSIHELDLAVYLNGPIESIRGYSELNHAEVSVHHADGGLSHLLLDRVTDPPVREVHVYRAHGDYDSLRLDTRGDGMYERELAHFIGCVEAGMQTINPLSAAVKVCARALEIVPPMDAPPPEVKYGLSV